MKIKWVTLLFVCSLLFAVPDKRIDHDNVHVYYAEKDEKIALISLNVVSDQQERLIKQYGLQVHPLHIYIADSKKTYRQYSGSSSPVWSAGLASDDRMLVKSPSFSRQSLSQFQKTLLHETVHLAVSGLPLPLWFNEGFAQYESGQFGLHQRVLVSKSFWRNQLKWAYEIEYLNQMNSDQAEVVYAQCAAMVDFMIDYFSIGLLGKCLNLTRDYRDFEKGFQGAFLMESKNFEKLFREKAKKQYRYYILLDQSNIWIFAPFILILGFILTKFRRKKMLKKWEAEEMSGNRKTK